MKGLASCIDYTLLRPGCQRTEVEALCQTAVARGYAAVCVPPYFVADARNCIPPESPVRIATVIGFPHGMHLTEIKQAEARHALQMGAQELDAMINLAAYFSGDTEYVAAELKSLVQLCEAHNALLKVIIETAYLSAEQVVALCKMCSEAGAHYVKTSTGFAPRGAEIETVRLMRQVLPAHIGVKASGGIRTVEAARAFIEAGAQRIGTSTAL